MKTMLGYLWLTLLLLLAIHGVTVIQNEWKRKSIHDHGNIVEVKIENLNCPNGTMTFHFGAILVEKQIDARTCVLFNEGQKIKLKHSQQFSDTFLFVNERSPNRFILGGLEVVLGIIGLFANWPRPSRQRSFLKKFPALSDN
jgi:hypothetical protein